jgi:hypothetical protein
VSLQSTKQSFDDLARALAEGSISRRGALKLLAGTAIAALIPSRALADDDDDCVRVCHVPRTSTGDCDFANARTRCVSRRERRRHLENHHPCDCRGSCANCLTPECQPLGGTCRGDIECCSSICESETCVACRSNGSGCSDGGECCSGNCDTSGENNICACQPNGGTCMANDQCCSGICEPRTTGSVCCIPEGTSTFGFCNVDADCCGVLECIDGICLPP